MKDSNYIADTYPKRITIVQAVAAVMVFVIVLTVLVAVIPQRVVSNPFEYEGYSYPEYSGYEKKSQYVEMSDGTKLAVDIYLPKGGKKNDSFPVIFQYTPYGRAFALPDQSVAEKIAGWIGTGTASSIIDRANSNNTVYGSSGDMVNLFLAHGYAYVCADMRGTGASYGWKRDFMPQLADDGYELVNWIEEQAWSDGNVGMFGGSYLGYSQLITAGKQPEALKAIIPEVVPLDGYTGEIRPGGIFLWTYSQQDMQIYLELNYYLPDEWYYPTAPVIDEDGDGDYADEIPLDLNGNGTFLDDYDYPNNPNDEPQYKDGKKREHIYYLAVYEHLQNEPYSSIGPEIIFIDTEAQLGSGENAQTLTAYDVGPGNYLSGIIESGIAVYCHGGWFDPFIRGSIELYSTLKETNPCKLIIDAGYHEGTSPYWAYFGENENSMLARYGTEYLRYFDRYLKGIQNGIDDEPPIYIYTMNGEGWHFMDEWTHSEDMLTELYLDGGNSINAARTATGTDEYMVDFTHDARWQSGWGDYKVTRWQMESPVDLPIRTEMDTQCLTYTMAPLTADSEVTGHPIIDLWVSSTANNGDFFVYLEDVDENGNAVLVTEGLLRAGFNQLFDNDIMINRGIYGIDVLPNLPWHGYEQGHYNENVFADGAIVNLKFDLLPTSWVFKKGHSIRISIACADSPTFEILSELSPNNDPTDPNNITPTITVYRNEQYASKILLPIVAK